MQSAASIKADAYGVGIEFAAPVYGKQVVRYFVAYLEEALARELLYDATIYVFSADADDFELQDQHVSVGDQSI